MNDKPVVTRFAPSPTGNLHIGGLRSALFNWLWAKKHNGTFILRIEDTDQARLVEGAQAQIIGSLNWLGLDYDFGPDKPGPTGPYIQSQRLDIYNEHIQILLDKGVAYRDWSSAERINELRQAAQVARKPLIFRRSLAITEGDLGEPHVIRIEIPQTQDISWVDHVKGDTSWRPSDVDDFIAIKSDGYPTYQFANVVDDHLMGVSHVIRADEWLSSTPKHIILYQAFGWELPEFVHIAPILGANGSKKLSKRDGAKDALDYAADGYLPQALMNYLALLGWNPKTEQEFFEPADLIEAFSLSGLQSSGAKFDEVRLDWLSGKHIRSLSVSELDQLAVSGKFWSVAALESSQEYRQQVLALVSERLKKLSELTTFTNFFFEDIQTADTERLTKESGFDTAAIRAHLEATLTLLEASSFDEKELEEVLHGYAKDNDLKVGKYFMLIRIAVTGTPVSPGLFETLSTLGKAKCLARISAQLA